MGSGDGNSIRFEFESYTFYPKTGELKHRGARVRINRQAAELLGLLLTNAGILVTRDQMRDVLWPDREQVEHDKVINNGISRLRYIFKDDPRQPKFIERIPKRGYRLIIAVSEIVPEPAPKSRTASLSLPAENYLAQEPESRLATGSLPGSPNVTSREESKEFWIDASAATNRRTHTWIVPLLLLLLVSGSLVAGALWWHGINENSRLPAMATARAESALKPITLGIVPFEANGPEAVEIASSMRLDLTDVLSKNLGIRMRAAHSLGNIKPDGTDLSRQMTGLGLDEVLFGRLSMKGKLYHFELELVRASDGTHTGTFQYTGSEHELGTITDRIQHDLLARLQMPALDNPSNGGTTDPVAYQAYLRGRYQFSLQNERSLPLALRYFSQAVQIDPKFARAYTYLARTNIVSGIHGFVPRVASLQTATESLAVAERLDADGGEVHALHGMLLYLRDWNLPAGQKELRRAIEIDPSDASYHQWLAITLSASGHNAEAQAEVNRARAIDPYWIPIFLTQSYVAHNAGNSALMIATARELKEMAPGSAYALDVMGNALWYDNQRVEAIAQWRNMAVQEHDVERIALEDRGAAALQSGGLAAYARVRISAMRTGQTGLHPNDFEPAEWYATARDNRAALVAMQRLYEERDPTFFDLALDPVLSGVRQMKEFQVLLHSIPGLIVPR